MSLDWFSVLGHSVSVVPGEHENEGDGGKRAEDETPSAGVAQSPEGNTPSWCLTTSPGVRVSCVVTYFTVHFYNMEA